MNFSKLFAPALLAGCAIAWAGSLNAAEPFTAETGQQASRITLKYRGRPAMVYEFAPDKYKPYVRELYSTTGVNLLQDSPHDHLHHHALMYGIKVNGENFWEELSGAGVQRVVSTSTPQYGKSRSGLPQAVIRQELVWIPAADAFLPLSNCAPLLVEHRTITLTIDEKASEVALLWGGSFQVGSRTNTVSLTGANYHGLGMRFQEHLDAHAVHISPDGRVNLAGSRQDTTVFPWEAVTFNTPGKPATIAVFGAPSNGRGAPRFFAMATPFAYLAATQTLDQEPLVYHTGDSFQLSYLVTLYPEIKSGESLQARSRIFSTSNN